MAYATTNPPFLLCASQDFRLWVYKSEDASTVVDAAGYFTNGWDLGMRAGDLLIQVDTDTSATTLMYCNAASSSSVDFTDGTAITATDTD